MYGLRRNQQWVTAPAGDGEPIPPMLTTSDKPDDAWLTPDINIAHDRQHLLRACMGMSTEIRAIRL